jgi:hypothetical protein
MHNSVRRANKIWSRMAGSAPIPCDVIARSFGRSNYALILSGRLARPLILSSSIPNAVEFNLIENHLMSDSLPCTVWVFVHACFCSVIL